MLLPAIPLLPNATRPHGTYTSQPVWVPPEAGYVHCTASGRGQWGRLGARQDVVDLRLEINTDGTWRTLGGCTTDASPKRGRDGQLAASTALRVRLPRQRSPRPQVRAVLQCRSQCAGALTLVFDTTQPPAQLPQAHHSVTYDNDNEAVALAATSVTVGAFTVGSNANRCMVVGVAGWDASTADSLVSSVSHNGSTTGWTSVITRLWNANTSDDRTSIWRKVAPDAVSATVVVTTGGTSSELSANALSVYDVDQTTPTAGAVGTDGTSGAISTTVTAATDDLVYAVCYSNASGGAATVGAGQTSRANTTIAGNVLLLASTEPGATSVAMTWTRSGNLDWVQAGCALKVAPAAAGHPAIRRFGGIGHGPRRTSRGRGGAH